MLSGEVNFRMDDTHVSGQSVASREGLLFGAQSAADFLLSNIVNRVLVTSEIVRPGKYGITRLPSGRIDALALVRSGLRIAFHKLRSRHTGSYSRSDIGRLSVSIAFMFLQFLRS